MTDIRKRFGAFDRLEMPDLWSVAQHREPQPAQGSGHERARKAIVIVTALALTVAATGIMIRTFNRGDDIEPVTGAPSDWPVAMVPDLGLSFRFPPEWLLQRYSEPMVEGALVTNADLEFHHPIAEDGSTTTAWDLSGLPTDGVFISIDQTSGPPGVLPPYRPDTPLPVSLSDATPVSQPPDPLGYTPKPAGTEERYLDFILNGQGDEVRIYFGPDASAESRAAAADIVASIGRSAPSVSSPPKGSFALIGGRAKRVGGLYVVADSEAPRKLLSGVFWTPSWSPDGEHILVIAPVPGSEADTQVLIVDARNGKTTLLTTLRLPQAAAWSPVGDEIAFSTGYGDVYLIRADGSGLKRLVAADNSCGAYGISWAPDASQIAFARTCGGGRSGRRSGIWVASIDGSDLHRVIADRTVLETSWSPDGNTLAFADQLSEHASVSLVGVDGAQPTVLATDADSPTWSPDGSLVAVIHAGRVVIVDRTGRAIGGLDLPADFSVSAVSWSHMPT